MEQPKDSSYYEKYKGIVENIKKQCLKQKPIAQPKGMLIKRSVYQWNEFIVYIEPDKTKISKEQGSEKIFLELDTLFERCEFGIDAGIVLGTLLTVCYDPKGFQLNSRYDTYLKDGNSALEKEPNNISEILLNEIKKVATVAEQKEHDNMQLFYYCTVAISRLREASHFFEKIDELAIDATVERHTPKDKARALAFEAKKSDKENAEQHLFKAMEKGNEKGEKAQS